MAKKFVELRKRMSANAQVQAEELTKKMLDELRRARGLSSKVLAGKLSIQQPAVAKLEKKH